MSINERIKYIIEALQAGSRREFADKVGISAAQVYNIIGVNGKIGEKNLSKILLAYPAVSQAWLRSEEGAMLTDGTTPAVSEEVKASRGRRARKAGKKAVSADAKTETATSTKRRTSKGRKPRTKKEIVTPAVDEQLKIALPKKGRATKTQEPKPAAPKKLDISADSDTKPASAINALIAGQRELITTNTKLVEANQQLVDLVLKYVKK